MQRRRPRAAPVDWCWPRAHLSRTPLSTPGANDGHSGSAGSSPNESVCCPDPHVAGRAQTSSGCFPTQRRRPVGTAAGGGPAATALIRSPPSPRAARQSSYEPRSPALDARARKAERWRLQARRRGRRHRRGTAGPAPIPKIFAPAAFPATATNGLVPPPPRTSRPSGGREGWRWYREGFRCRANGVHTHQRAAINHPPSPRTSPALPSQPLTPRFPPPTTSSTCGRRKIPRACRLSRRRLGRPRSHRHRRAAAVSFQRGSRHGGSLGGCPPAGTRVAAGRGGRR